MYVCIIRYNGFGDSDDCQVLEQLLDAMNQGDENAASSVLNMPLFKYLDNDVRFIKCHYLNVLLFGSLL